jgi:hypothetical protein
MQALGRLVQCTILAVSPKQAFAISMTPANCLNHLFLRPATASSFWLATGQAGYFKGGPYAAKAPARRIIELSVGTGTIAANSLEFLNDPFGSPDSFRHV